MLRICCGLFGDAGAFWASVMGLYQDSIRDIFQHFVLFCEARKERGDLY